MFIIWAFFDFFKWGIQYFDTINVPLVLIECIKSYLFIIKMIEYLFMSVASVSVSEIALALLMSISIPPNVATAFSMAAFTSLSFRMSHWIPRALPPASSISLHALAIVPGNLGCGSTVLARITTLAPSWASLLPIASPIPRDAPLMRAVLPLRSPLLSNSNN